MKLIQNLFLVLGLLAVCTSRSEAHAYLDHAEPKVGSTVKASPSVVKIWFMMEVQGALTKIEVFDAAGREIDKEDSKVDAADKTLMVVSVPKLEAGAYKVVWHAVCPWGHHTTGNFTFKVTEPGRA